MDNFWGLSIGFIFAAFAVLSILRFAPDTKCGEDSECIQDRHEYYRIILQKINDEDNG